jgi:uncharacterized membrane protein (Fun14 family)
MSETTDVDKMINSADHVARVAILSIGLLTFRLAGLMKYGAVNLNFKKDQQMCETRPGMGNKANGVNVRLHARLL